MGCAKYQDLARVYRHFLTRLGVAPYALALGAHEEAAEGGDLHVLAARQGIRDLLEHDLHQVRRLVAREADLLVDGLAQLRPRYRSVHPPPHSTISRLAVT